MSILHPAVYLPSPTPSEDLLPQTLSFIRDYHHLLLIPLYRTPHPPSTSLSHPSVSIFETQPPFSICFPVPIPPSSPIPFYSPVLILHPNFGFPGEISTTPLTSSSDPQDSVPKSQSFILNPFPISSENWGFSCPPAQALS